MTGSRPTQGREPCRTAPISTFNGQWVAPIRSRDFPVIDPSTEEVCATISLGEPEDTEAAVAAANAAFAGWAATPVAERIAALERLLEAYKRRAPRDMAQAISTEMGAPIDWARQQQVTSGDWHFEGFIAAAKEMDWDRPLGPHAPGERIFHEPIGVVALITPWNWPMNQIALKVAPALLAGCTMVLKPSEEAPLSGLVFCRDRGCGGAAAGGLQPRERGRAGGGQHAERASRCRHGELHRVQHGPGA